MLGFLGNDPGPEPLPRQRIIAFYVCWALLVPALCYVFMADAPMIFLLAVPLSLLSLIKKTSYRLSNRAKVYSFVIPLVFSVLLDMFYKVDMNHFFISISTLCPLLIFYGLSISLLDQRPETLVTAMVCGLGAMLIQGLTLSPADLQRMSIPHPIVLNRFKLFILAVLAQSYSILHLPRLAVRLNRDVRNEEVGLQIKRALLTMMSTVLVFALAVGVSFGSAKTFKLLDPFFSDSYRNFLERRTKKVLFKSTITTDSTLSWKVDKYGKKPAFFVTSATAPGYVRGRTYVRYEKGEWSSERLRDGDWVPDAPAAMPLISGTGGLSVSRWLADDVDENGLTKADVYLANNYSPEVLYLPGNVKGIELIADRLSRTTDGIHVPSSWDESAGYRYFVTTSDQAASFPTPTNPGQGYLQVSDEVLSTAYMHGMQAAENSVGAEKKVQAVVTYLKRHFTYSLQPKKRKPKEVDPVVHFLDVSKEGHCELFASAAVAMLRCQGVKCRYVTGFICFETLPGGTHVARFKHCHAWAEAWIPEKGWTYLEPTPASGVPEPDTHTLWTGIMESTSTWITHVLAIIKRGYFAQAVIDGFFATLRFLKFTFFSVYGVVTWPLLLWLLHVSIARIRRGRPPKTSHKNSLRFIEIRKILMTFLKRRGIVYVQDMSLRDVIHCVGNEPEFKDLVLEYEHLRYCSLIQESELREFSARFSKWVRTRKTSTQKP